MTLKLYANNKDLVDFLQSKKDALMANAKADSYRNVELSITEEEYDISVINIDTFIIQRKKSVV